MENELFLWGSWDQVDTATFIFHDVYLVTSIGEFKAGTKFDFATISWEHGQLLLGNEGDDNPAKFELGLRIKP